MLEFLTGTGLALAAGLNAWIPLVLLGALDRFTGLIELPAAWAWLANEWVLLILLVLLVLEFVAEVKKRSAPIVDDWIKKASAKGVDAARILAEFREELKKVAAGR